jgi:hypothetical protein
MTGAGKDRIELLFPGMAERRVAEVMRQARRRDRVRTCLAVNHATAVEFAVNRQSYLFDFQAVGQSIVQHQLGAA